MAHSGETSGSFFLRKTTARARKAIRLVFTCARRTAARETQDAASVTLENIKSRIYAGTCTQTACRVRFPPSISKAFLTPSWKYLFSLCLISLSPFFFLFFLSLVVSISFCRWRVVRTHVLGATEISVKGRLVRRGSWITLTTRSSFIHRISIQPPVHECRSRVSRIKNGDDDGRRRLDFTAGRRAFSFASVLFDFSSFHRVEDWVTSAKLNSPRANDKRRAGGGDR